MTSKSGKNEKVAHEVQPSVSLMFLPHFSVEKLCIVDDTQHVTLMMSIQCWKKVLACKLANLCFILDLFDMLSDEEENENLTPGEVPTTVVVDSFGKTFEDAVSISV